QILALKEMIEDARDALEAEVVRLDGRIDEAMAQITLNRDFAGALANQVNSLSSQLALKANVVDVYSKEQTHSLIQQTIDGVYTKEETDDILTSKTDKTGNHEGTWQGLRPSDFSRLQGAQYKFDKVQHRVVLDTESNQVEIGFDINPTIDLLLVRQNSIPIEEGFEYNIVDNTIVKLDGTWEAGTTLHFIGLIVSSI